MTRREQWIKQRARYLRRAQRARNINSKWGSRILHGRTVRLGYVVVWTHSGMMPPCPVSGEAYEWNDFLTDGNPSSTFEVGEVGKGSPPHPTLPEGIAWPNANNAGNNWQAAVGYHRRRVHKWKRKPNRLNKFQRAIWLANMLAWKEGYFPTWDPLHRHPDPDDIANGAPYVSEFPNVPHPWPTGPEGS